LNLKRTIAAAMMILALAACHHQSSAAQRILRSTADPELLKLTKEQVFQRGEDQFAKKKWAKARSYYMHVYENFPNDPLGRRSLLRIADAYYEQGDAANLVEAQYKYRDFINRYPGSDRADYAMLQIAMCSYKQMERPDRDQQKTREAAEKFRDMLTAFPKSPLRGEADKRYQDVLDRLAKHDHLIARFYIKRGSYNAAIGRLNGIVDQYPNYNERAGVFFDLGTALNAAGRTAEARLYFERVIAEFPSSDYASRAKRKLGTLKAA
jgi:outer membrane protein assembly factor BamD